MATAAQTNTNDYTKQLEQLISNIQNTPAYTPSSTTNPYTAQVEQLLGTIQNSGGYTPTEYKNPYADQLLALTAPKTDEEYRQQAENWYLPQFNAALESLQQANEKEQLGFQQQLDQLKTALDDTKQGTNAAYAKNISDLNNSMLRRGMARSSFASQTEANARKGWGEALAKVDRDYLAAVGNVNAQQQLAISHMAQSEARLKNDLATNIANYEQTLRGNDKAAQLQAYQQLSSAYDAWAQQQEQLKATMEQQKTSNIIALTQYLTDYQQQENQFNAQMQANAQQQQTSNIATLLQFLADYQQSGQQFDQQMALEQAKFAWQQEQVGTGGKKSTLGGDDDDDDDGSGGGGKIATYWDDFNERVAAAFTPNGTSSVSKSSTDLYAAAAQYALAQQEKKLRGW